MVASSATSEILIYRVSAEGIASAGISADIDLRAAINAVSDVIQNRPRRLREFDQIYMKAGTSSIHHGVVASGTSARNPEQSGAA